MKYLAIVLALALSACHDHEGRRPMLICAPCDGDGPARRFSPPLSIQTMRQEAICFPKDGPGAGICWYGCPQPFPAPAKCED